MRFDVVTIFPGFFETTLQFGVVARAVKAGVVDFRTVDLRSFAHDRHRTVDDRPFGGGEGMVLKPEPLMDAIESTGISPKDGRDTGRESVILLSAQGQKFDQRTARELAARNHIVLVCGRYEGVDERVNELACDHELSIGDYVLSGGELGAAVIVDAVSRLLPGVLGNPDSAHYESFGAAGDAGGEPSHPRSVAAAAGLLDYPHYTRPPEFRGRPVPEVLCGGDHAAIRKWRRERALEKTLRNRPDLLRDMALGKEDEKILRRIGSEKRQDDSGV